MLKPDTGKPWLIRRGRNWIDWGDWSGRNDGWWLFGYRVWMPRLRYLPPAIKYWLDGNGNNIFYTPERREKYNINLDE